MTIFREISATEKRRELAVKMAQLEQEENREWGIREATIGKIFGDVLRSGKLSGADFLHIITPLVPRRGDWKKLGIEAVPDPAEYPAITENAPAQDSAKTPVHTNPVQETISVNRPPE